MQEEQINPYKPPESDLEDRPATTADFSDSPLAGRGSRLVAAIADSFLNALVLVPLMFVSGTWERMMVGEWSLLESAGWFVAGTGVYLLIHGWTLHASGQTLGKKALKIQAVDYDTGRLVPLSRVFGARVLPISVVAQIPFIGTLASLVDSLFIFRGDRRCVHDFIARTKVVTYQPDRPRV